MAREAKTDARMAADLDMLRGMLAREMKTSWAGFARGLQMHFSLQSFSLQSWKLASSAEFTVDGSQFKAGESCRPKGSATRLRYGFFGCDGTGCELGGACCDGGCAAGCCPAGG